MPPKGHAILSASSPDRWLHCPPSARLCETYEDKGSDYAAEGTDAHSLCEYKLRKALGMKATDPTKSLDWYNTEMEDCATGYACFIMELLEEVKQTCSDPVVLIEQRVDFSRWVEQGFGTSDAILISDSTMHVIDYKHGLGILVSAEDNPQMKCYALGALELFDDIYDIDTVSMTIYQPRRQNVTTYEVSKDAVSKAVKAAGFDPYEKKLLGITAMQKLLGKSRFEELLAAYIEKPQGKPTLVPESDKRPAMNTAKNDFMEEYDNE